MICVRCGNNRANPPGNLCVSCVNASAAAVTGHTPPAVCEVLMHEVLLPDFEKWLNARGLVLQRTPFLDSDPELPTYNVAPGPELMRRVGG